VYLAIQLLYCKHVNKFLSCLVLPLTERQSCYNCY